MRVGHDYDAISDLDLHNEASPFNYHAEDDNDDDAFEDAHDTASNADSDPRHDHKWVHLLFGKLVEARLLRCSHHVASKIALISCAKLGESILHDPFPSNLWFRC